MTKTLNFKRNGLAVGIALTLFAAPLLTPVLDTGTAQAGIIAEAQAAEDGGAKGGHQGAMGAQRGGKSQKGGSAAGQRSGNKSVGDILAGEGDGEDSGDEDSDRPAWAGGNKELNPHRGDGNAGGDTKKGGDFGDIWVILRDDLGNPILDANGNIQPCLDAACTEVVQLTADGELPPEYADNVIAVEFGRLNISRAPDKVLEHSLVEALTKLDGGVLGSTVTLDPSGRLVVDGDAIDSPLENLALYEALLTTPAVDGVVTLSITTTVEGSGDVTFTFAVPESERLDLAASALAAASDKTGDLNVDEVVNISKFLGVDDELAALVGDYTYDRTDTYGDVNVWILMETSPGVFEPRLVPVADSVDFNDLPLVDDDTNGIDRFAQAADDSVTVLEFVHDNALDQ
ncbi:MAG TPA: hypothetical protein VIR60_03180 [Gammaproteobacteria bacterium]